MIDIKKYIAELIEDIAPVELTFSDTENDTPLICISETDNSSEIILSGRDRVSRIVIQLDLYGENAFETESMAVLVNERLVSKGFRRSFSQLILNERRARRCLRYTFGIDETQGRILSLK